MSTKEKPKDLRNGAIAIVLATTLCTMGAALADDRLVVGELFTNVS